MKKKEPLKVVLVNPPSKEEADLIIDNLSNCFNSLYSQSENKKDVSLEIKTTTKSNKKIIMEVE